MAKTGRPKKKIDWKQFEKLCAFQCTLVEIASWFECSDDTIERAVKKKYGATFAEVYKKKSSKGLSSLRRAQYKKALSGNPTMLIWLGKQYLEQKDKAQVDGTVTHEHFFQNVIRKSRERKFNRFQPSDN